MTISYGASRRRQVARPGRRRPDRVRPPAPAIAEDLRKQGQKEIGSIAKPRQAMLVPELSKLRFGKFTRWLLKDVAEHGEVADMSRRASSAVMDCRSYSTSITSSRG